MEDKIGVIVPIYKVEKYIAECIESILAQTYTNFRLILVDDGTPDNAGKICDEYAEKDSRITVIHQENAGVTRARARGVEEADDCEFITFVDGDDNIPQRALETLMAHMKPDINITQGGITRFHSVIEDKEDKDLGTKVISHEKYKEDMLLGKDAGPVAKLIRKTLLKSRIYDIPREINMGEDVIASTRIAFENDKDVVYTKSIVYNYRQHSESCMHTFKKDSEYEELFMNHLWMSVPEKHKERYRKPFIKHKILTFDYHFGYSTEIPEWIGTNFHKTLLADIKEQKFKALPIERMLLTARNKNLRKVLILAKRIKNKLFTHSDF
ncbi:MAG: glycosyltransferase [Bacteroidaceae bacterium]|nr:glycosyltransferase [Bacteroidaceae bacterium]